MPTNRERTAKAYGLAPAAIAEIRRADKLAKALRRLMAAHDAMSLPEDCWPSYEAWQAGVDELDWAEAEAEAVLKEYDDANP